MEGLFLPKGCFAMEALGRVAPLIAAPRDPQDLWQEFEITLLDRLRAIGPTWIPVVGVKAALDGTVKIMCMGADRHGYWRKFSIRFNLPLLHQRKWLGDPDVMAQCIYEILDRDDPTKEPSL